MPEDYVRPPIVAIDPPDPAVAKWRFRGIVALIVVILAVAVILLAHAIIASGNPGSVTHSGGHAARWTSLANRL